MHKLNSGVTMIEIIVVVAIMGITMYMTMPNTEAMIDRNRSDTHVHDFMTALSLARSEALKVGGVVSVQATDSSASGNEFGKGWCVVEGNPGNCNGTLIRSFTPITSSSTLNSIEDVTSIAFNNLGELNNGAVQNVDLCTSSNTNRRIFVSLVGRSRAYRVTDVVVAKRPAC